MKFQHADLMLLMDLYVETNASRWTTDNPVSDLPGYEQAPGLVPLLVCHWICPGTGVTTVYLHIIYFISASSSYFPLPTGLKSNIKSMCYLAVLHTLVADR